MRSPSKLVAVAVLAASVGVASTAAAQTAPSVPAPARVQPPTPEMPARPYSRLFKAAPGMLNPPLRFDVRPNSARRFHCTLIVVPADSRLDPTFEKPLGDRTTRFTMQVVQPTCL
jgi:hypothetical protein